jgi:hypothetical protein
MKKIILLLWLANIFCLTFPQTTYTVKPDGTGDFTYIQQAIGGSVSGDTIVVYPGRYFESISIISKNIYLTSLFKITNNRDDIYNTIIDANHENGVVLLQGVSRNAVLNGFTIQNGIGFDTGQYWIINPEERSRSGGGIYIGDGASPCILNCIIQNNTASGYGGGIQVVGYSGSISHPFLSGNVIKNNTALVTGGGLCTATLSYVEFDSVTRKRYQWENCK